MQVVWCVWHEKGWVTLNPHLGSIHSEIWVGHRCIWLCFFFFRVMCSELMNFSPPGAHQGLGTGSCGPITWMDSLSNDTQGWTTFGMTPFWKIQREWTMMDHILSWALSEVMRGTCEKNWKMSHWSKVMENTRQKLGSWPCGRGSIAGESDRTKTTRAYLLCHAIGGKHILDISTFPVSIRILSWMLFSWTDISRAVPI